MYNSGDLDLPLLLALVVFAGSVNLWLWRRRTRSGSQDRLALTVLAILALVSGIYLALAIFRSSQVTVAPNEHVIVTRFGKPVRDPVSEPGSFSISPFGIDRVHRFPMRIQSHELSCDGFEQSMIVTVSIFDPLLFMERAQTIENLDPLLCRSFPRHAGADEPSESELNTSIRDFGLSVEYLK